MLLLDKILNKLLSWDKYHSFRAFLTHTRQVKDLKSYQKTSHGETPIQFSNKIPDWCVMSNITLKSHYQPFIKLVFIEKLWHKVSEPEGIQIWLLRTLDVIFRLVRTEIRVTIFFKLLSLTTLKVSLETSFPQDFSLDFFFKQWNSEKEVNTELIIIRRVIYGIEMNYNISKHFRNFLEKIWT